MKARQTIPVKIVRVEVHNGVVDVLEKPRGIRLIVMDYDTLNVAAGADVWSEKTEIKRKR